MSLGGSRGGTRIQIPWGFPFRTTSDPPVPNGTFPGFVPSGAKKKKVQTCVIGRPPGRLIGGSGGRSPPVRKKLKLVSGRASCAWARRQSSGDTSSFDLDWERWQFKTDRGWQDFDTLQQAELSQGYHRHATVITMKHNNSEYSVNLHLNQMQQCNKTTLKVREIRWSASDPPAKLHYAQKRTASVEATATKHTSVEPAWNNWGASQCSEANSSNLTSGYPPPALQGKVSHPDKCKGCCTIPRMGEYGQPYVNCGAACQLAPGHPGECNCEKHHRGCAKANSAVVKEEHTDSDESLADRIMTKHYYKLYDTHQNRDDPNAARERGKRKPGAKRRGKPRLNRRPQRAAGAPIGAPKYS